MLWEPRERRGERRIEQTMPGPSAALGGTLTPLFLLCETISLYWAFFLLEVSSGHHLPTAGGWGWERRGGKAGDVLTLGLKGWRFLDAVWGQLGVWGCTWELSCGLCTTALHRNGTVQSSGREMRKNIARNPVFFTLRTRRINFCKVGSLCLGLSPGVLHPRNNFFSFRIIYCYSLRL